MIFEPNIFNPFSSFSSISALFISKDNGSLALDYEIVEEFSNFISKLREEFNPKFKAKIKLDAYIDKEIELKDCRDDLLSLSQQLTSEEDKSLIEETINELEGLILTLSKTIQEKVRFIFSRKLDALYSQKYSSRSYLQNYLDVSQQTVSTYFNGMALPSIDKLLKISSLLNCSIDYLLKEDVVEPDLSDDIIYKEIGLSSKAKNLLTTNKSKGQEYHSRITNTLNFLIEGTEDYETDILSDIRDFLYPSTTSFDKPFHIVDRGVFEHFYEVLKNSESTDVALASYKNLLSYIDKDERLRRESFKDIDTLHLTIIQKKLIRLKDKVMEELQEEDLYLYNNIFDDPYNLTDIPSDFEDDNK